MDSWTQASRRPRRLPTSRPGEPLSRTRRTPQTQGRDPGSCSCRSPEGGGSAARSVPPLVARDHAGRKKEARDGPDAQTGWLEAREGAGPHGEGGLRLRLGTRPPCRFRLHAQTPPGRERGRRLKVLGVGSPWAWRSRQGGAWGAPRAAQVGCRKDGDSSHPGERLWVSFVKNVAPSLPEAWAAVSCGRAAGADLARGRASPVLSDLGTHCIVFTVIGGVIHAVNAHVFLKKLKFYATVA